MTCELHEAAATSWSGSIPATLAIAAALVIHCRGWRCLRRGLHPEATRRASRSWVAFVAGILVVWVVVGSPLAGLDRALLTFHMIQHLLLMTIAAPLILLGAPAAAFLRGLPRPVGRAAGALLQSAPARRIGRPLIHPVSCWIAGTAVVVAWHVPPAHELGMSSPGWHVVQHASFLAAGLLFWRPVIAARSSTDPSDRVFVPVYLFLATLPCDTLSAFLAFCGRVVYPSHRTANAPFGLSGLQDQECAGALMWFWVTVAYLLPAAVTTFRMLSPSKRLPPRCDAPATG
jgi:cytochrome c oxidase assembly factor CtaG